MKSFYEWIIHLPLEGLAILIYIIWVCFFLLVKKIFMVWIRRACEKTQTKLDDLLAESLNFPLILFIFSSGGVFVQNILPFEGSERWLEYGSVALKVTTILACIVFSDRFLRGLIREYGSRTELFRTMGSVAQGFVRGTVLGIGILILLDTFGLSITPILASLGIGSLAVALALQPTLENFFSGIQVVADRLVQAGQYIRLDSGEEGYVEKIGWRSTWIRTLPNNMIIVPNKSLMTSKLTNYYYPQKEMAVLVEVGVSYDSDLKQVERVTVDVARQVLATVSGGIKSFDPFIRLHTFDQSSINFTVILRVGEFVDQYLVKHEFIKTLHERYKTEGIVIPFPIRTLDVKPEVLQMVQSISKS